MEKTYRFYDFAVPFNDDEKEMRHMIMELIELGYKTIAIEHFFDHSHKEMIKRGADIFPAPANVDSLIAEFKQQIRILQRLTIIYNDIAITHAMINSMNLRKYNLIAGQPKTDATLTHCCTTFGGDIVTFDPDSGVKLLVNKKAYQIAMKRGMFFEIKYSPAIRDSNNRKDMIKIAHNYGVRGKPKNIIFSSGALNVFELRGPYDVANLAFIFGLSEDQGKNAIDKSCRQLFLRAESRRIGKTIMFVKATGPICLSDTESSESEDSDINMNDIIKTKESDASDDSISSSKECEKSEDEMPTQPNKKKKLS